MEHNEYKPYTEREIYELFNNVRGISKDPYMLHAAFMLSCLFDVAPQNDDEEEYGTLIKPEDNWGWIIPKDVLKSIVKNGNEQFIYASEHDMRIDVWGYSYSIRKSKLLDKSRFVNIFDFPTTGDDYIVTKSGVMKLNAYSDKQANNNIKEEYEDNKMYLRKVIMVAEDDNADGWDNLTDIETTMYMWAIYYRKYGNCTAQSFHNHFKKNLYTSIEDERECWNAVALLNNNPHGLYTFSAEKVREWNKKHGQESVIDSVDDEMAKDYWYNVAVKTTCKS